MPLSATSIFLFAATQLPAPVGPGVVLTLTSNETLPLCLSAESLRDRVQARLGRPVFVMEPSASQGASALMIDITLALWKEDPPTWDVELNLSHRAPDGSQMLVGRRNLRLKADACENLLAPLVFIVTLTIDPNAAQRPEPARVEPMPAAAPAKAAEPIATQAVPKWRLALGVGIGSGWGTVPNLSALGHLRFMLSRQSWPAFAINLGYQRSSDVFHDAPSPREADVAFSASNVGLELLPQIWKQIYLLAALSCQTVSAGGAEFNRSQDGRTYGCSTGAGVLGLMPITARTSLFLRTEAGLAWQRARYTFMSASGTTEQGYRSSPILLTLAAGLSFSF